MRSFALGLVFLHGFASAVLAVDYIGCYHDCCHGRDLSMVHCAGGLEPAGSRRECGNSIPKLATVEDCAKACSGYSYLGLQYGGQCFCGNEYGHSALGGKAAESECNLPCPGNSTEVCGAFAHNSIYRLPTAPLYECLDQVCLASNSTKATNKTECEKTCGKTY